jgi:hypothetical protein
MGGYLLNYNRWRALHESLSLNEAFEVGSLEAVTTGDKVKPFNFLPRITFTAKDHNKAYSIMTKTIGSEAIPLLYVGRGGDGVLGTYVNKINTNLDRLEAFGALLVGIAQYAGDEDLIKNDGKYSANKVDSIIEKFNITSQPGTKVQLYGAAADKIDTIGKVNSDSVTETDKRKTSSLSAICAYINMFNLTNWAVGNFTQYDPTKIVDKDNIVDLTGSGGGTVKESGYLMLVSPASASVTGGSVTTTTETPQGKEAQTGTTEIAFTALSADTDDKGLKVDANHPKVKEIGDKIISYLGDNGVADSMTLISSASPEYNSGKGGPSKLEDYAAKKKPTSGTAAPASVVDDYDKNAKLAYDRGVTFRNALAAYLGGHVNATNIAISWKISLDEPGGGKNISYSIATKSEAAQPITKTQYQGAKVTVEKGNNTLILYKIKWDAGSVAKNKTGLFVKDKIDYNNLKSGQAIIILAKDMKTKVGDTDKAEDQVTVSKIEDNNVYINYKEQKDVLLPKDRYVRQYGKIDKTKNVEI